jgi:hypothetical protein
VHDRERAPIGSEGDSRHPQHGQVLLVGAVAVVLAPGAAKQTGEGVLPARGQRGRVEQRHARRLGPGDARAGADGLPIEHQRRPVRGIGHERGAEADGVLGHQRARRRVHEPDGAGPGCVVSQGQARAIRAEGERLHPAVSREIRRHRAPVRQVDQVQHVGATAAGGAA